MLLADLFETPVRDIKKQTKKFGNSFPPPLLHPSAAKNSTPNKLMNLGLKESVQKSKN